MDCSHHTLRTVRLADRVGIRHVEVAHRSLLVAEVHTHRVRHHIEALEEDNPAVRRLAARRLGTGHNVALAVGSREREKRRNWEDTDYMDQTCREEIIGLGASVSLRK